LKRRKEKEIEREEEEEGSCEEGRRTIGLSSTSDLGDVGRGILNLLVPHYTYQIRHNSQYEHPKAISKKEMRGGRTSGRGAPAFQSMSR